MKVVCVACHKIPANFNYQGHIDDSKGAEVNLSDLALNVTNEILIQDYDSGLPLFTPAPSYSMTNQTCANNYCHGYFKNGNTDNIVSFNDGSDGVKCDSCQGNSTTGEPLSKTSAEGGKHPNISSCNSCHSGVVDLVNGNWVMSAPTKHINGLLIIFGQERDY